MSRLFSLRKVAAASLLLLVCAVAGLAWFAGSELVLRSLVDRAVASSAGKLEVSGVHGSLYGPLRIDQLSYATGFQRVEAQQLELDWSPGELLLHQRLRISKLQMRQLDVNVIKVDPEPLQQPLSLRLPIDVEIADARAERLVVHVGGGSYELGALQTSLNYRDGQYHFAAGMDGSWGKANTMLALPASPPFALNGSLAILAGHYSASSNVGGNLAAITLAGEARATDVKTDAMDGHMQAVLTPFQKTFLQQIVLQAHRLDPQHYLPDLPQADLALDLTLQAEPSGAFQGALKVLNTLPGPIDHARLPLRELGGAFEGGFEALSLRDIRLDMGEAGRFTGSGNLQQQRLHFDLSTAAFNLRGMHSKLKPTRLAGAMRFELASDAQSVQALLEQQHYQIRLDAAHRDAMVEIKQASIMSAGSELSLSGALPLDKTRAFHAQGKLRNFNPNNFGDYPAAAINAEFSAEGSMRPQLQTALHLSIADSSYRGQTLGGQGDSMISAERIWDTALKLNLGNNRLSAEGAFGMAEDRLKWQLDAPDIGALGSHFAGQAQATGEIGGSWTQPDGQFSLSAVNLNWDNTQHLAQLSAKGKLAPGADGELALNAELSGYHSGESKQGGLALDHATLAVTGRRSHHEIELAARNKLIDAHAMLEGAWLGEQGWEGAIRRFENQGRYPATLVDAAKFSASPERFSLTDAAVALAQGTVHIDELALHSGSLSSRGRIEALNVADLLKMADERAEKIVASLTLGGKWRVEAADERNGEIELWREQGDVAAPGVAGASLGLSRLTCTLAMANSQLSGKLEMEGTALGHVVASVESVLARKGNAWSLEEGSPLAAQVDASMPSVAWVSPLLGAQIEIDGAVEAHFSAAGTVLEPKLSGVITGDKLKFSYPGQGVYLKDGSLRALMRENQFILEQLLMHGKEGNLSGKGSLSLEAGKPAMQIGFVADKLQAMNRPDRQLILSGNGEMSLRDGLVQVAAKLKADDAHIAWGKGDAPTLSQDVVVLGREHNNSPKTNKVSLDLELDLDLGDQFFFKGDGIDARLEGAINLTGKGGELPAATGIIRVAQGSYFAYGQSLAIERGILNFSGPMDNPGLNIIALRKNQPVEAGVTITGTLMQPQIKLTSNPVVPDGEKLSWLVLGHGLDSSSGTEFSLLQSAANALLSKGNSVTLQSRIAQAAGLDELVLTGNGGLESSVLTVGKRLSSRAYLSYEQGLAGMSNAAKISYTLSKRLSVKAKAGTENAVDLFYDFTFD
jgi:translocation and assembly module TamB